MEVLFHRRQVPSGMLLKYYKNAPAARQFFAPELQPFFDQIWNLHQQHVQRFVQAWQAASEEIRERMRPGTPEGDILTLLYGDPSIEERNGIFLRLAKRAPVSLQDRGAKERLEIEARACGKEAGQLLTEVIRPAALLEAESGRDLPQRVIYRGKKMKTTEGDSQPRPSAVLTDVQFLEWVSEEANRIIRASLLDEPYPPRPKDALSAKHRSRKPSEDVLLQQVDMNGDPAGRLEVANLVDVLKKKLTPAERRDLELLVAEPDRNKVASESGRTRGAVDVSAHRIKKKLAAL